MSKIKQGVQSVTEKYNDVAGATKRANDFGRTVGETGMKGVQIAGQAVLLSLSKAWVAIGITKPATTDKYETETVHDSVAYTTYREQESTTPDATKSRYDTSKMWSIKFGDYFLPLSQTYSVRARKRLNMSSLVDGIDILQQVRKEAKTIDCTLKISLRDTQPNLQFIKEDSKAVKEVAQLQAFLEDLYEDDIVFQVDNETLNDTLGIDYVIMSDYKFMPRAGSQVFIFEFSLTEIKFGDNILTFDEKQIQQPDIEDDSNIA